jgi:hypothetical protein
MECTLPNLLLSVNVVVVDDDDDDDDVVVSQ